MSTKFFTLIHDAHVRRAPKSKVIPAESFSTLLEAKEVLDQIKKDAELYRLEVVKECEHLKEQALQEGYEEGFKKWSEHLVQLEEETQRVYKEIEKLIIPVALKAAKKIVERELELSDTVIVDIVAANLRAVSQHKRVTIYVNKKDLESLEKQRPRLREIFEALESLSIRDRDDITPGSCTIETEIGIINAQMEHRWHLLEKAFKSLIKQSPPG